MTDHVIDALTTPAWVGRAADVVADTVKDAYAAGGDQGLRVKSLLNGVWLGHPLHPALTDIPLGAWTTALVCDAAHAATGRKDLAHGASVAIAVGLAGAVGAAVAGITDWSDTDGRARRVGFVHGALNLTATALFATSFVARRRSRDEGGRVWALLGYGCALGAAYLGGDLVYGERIGVNHAAGQDAPDEFTRVMAFTDLDDHAPTRVMAGTTPVLLVREGDTVHALAETCSHLGGPLSEGTLKDGGIVCPWHGSCFALDDGHVINGPATHGQPCFETRVRDGHVEIRAPRAPQGRADRTAASSDATWRGIVRETHGQGSD